MADWSCNIVYNWFREWRCEFLYHWRAVYDCLRDKQTEPKALKGVKEKSMNVAEKKELITRIKAMSDEEIMVALEHIPVDLCLKRVNAELNRLYTLENSLVGLIKRD